MVPLSLDTRRATTPHSSVRLGSLSALLPLIIEGYVFGLSLRNSPWADSKAGKQLCVLLTVQCLAATLRIGLPQNWHKIINLEIYETEADPSLAIISSLSSAHL